MHLFGFIIRIYHDAARSSDCQIWQHVFVVTVVLLIARNDSEAHQSLQSVIQSGRGYQPITAPCSTGRIMLHDSQLLAETENIEQ